MRGIESRAQARHSRLQAQLEHESHQRSSVRTPRGLPDTETLAKRIESMNHETSKGLHILVYLEGGVYMTYEEGRDLVIHAQERFATVIENLVWLLAIISRDEQLSGLARKCRIQLESCFRVATRRDSSESPAPVSQLEQALGIGTSLPEVLRRTRSEFEDIAKVAKLIPIDEHEVSRPAVGTLSSKPVHLREDALQPLTDDELAEWDL